MFALTNLFEALAVDSEPDEAPPTLLEALARAPAAAALVVAALGEADRRALRLAHSELRAAVAEATTGLEARFDAAAPARPPTPRRWPRLERLALHRPGSAALEALGHPSRFRAPEQIPDRSGAWAGLRLLCLDYPPSERHALDAPAARALAAALRRMPALRALGLRNVRLPDEAARALFRASRAEPAPRLRALAVEGAGLTPAAARALAASGWRLEELRLRLKAGEAAAGVAALVAAPTFALRCLRLWHCGLDAAALLSLAHTPWPLEELEQ
jgi:hypothetical protein